MGLEGCCHPVSLVFFLPLHHVESGIALVAKYNSSIVIIYGIFNIESTFQINATKHISSKEESRIRVFSLGNFSTVILDDPFRISLRGSKWV